MLDARLSRSVTRGVARIAAKLNDRPRRPPARVDFHQKKTHAAMKWNFQTWKWKFPAVKGKFQTCVGKFHFMKGMFHFMAGKVPGDGRKGQILVFELKMQVAG